MRLTKLTATLFATTIMASMITMPEATFGAGEAARYHEALTAKANREAGALADPATVFAGGNGAGTLNRALRDAVRGGAAPGAAAGMPLGNPQEKTEALAAIVRSPNAADVPHNVAIRKALGLKFDAAALNPRSEDTRKLDAFVQTAEEKLVHLPGAHAAIAGQNELLQALSDPLGVIAENHILSDVLRAASGDGASASHGTIRLARAAGALAPAVEARYAAEKLAALREIEEAPIGGADDAHKIAVRAALGLADDINGAGAGAITQKVAAFKDALYKVVYIYALTHINEVFAHLDPMFAHAVANVNSNLNGQGNANRVDKLALIHRLIAHVNAGGAHADDIGYARHVLGSLGLDTTIPAAAGTLNLLEGFRAASRP